MVGADDQRRRLTAICERLPEVEAERAGRHVVFRVRGRTFAYFQDDHHGDGRVALVCKVDAGENAALADSDLARFFLPSYVGRHGWVGFRLDAPAVAWAEVEELVLDSYRRIAPRRLARSVDPPDTPTSGDEPTAR